MIMMICMKQKWELHLEMQIQKEEDMLEEVVMQGIIYVENKNYFIYLIYKLLYYGTRFTITQGKRSKKQILMSLKIIRKVENRLRWFDNRRYLVYEETYKWSSFKRSYKGMLK